MGFRRCDMQIHYFQRYHSKENVDTSNTMLMLSMMGGQGSMDFAKNPMMMYFLMKDSKNMDELLPLMFMGNLCK